MSHGIQATNTSGPAQKMLVLMALSYEPKLSESPARAFPSAIHKVDIQATNTSGPAKEILVLIALRSRYDSYEHKLPQSPATVIFSRIHKV